MNDPANDIYSEYGQTICKAVDYVIENLESEDITIICAMIDKNFNHHMNPSYDIDDTKIIDLLEEWGEDNDLPEDWWMNECEMNDIVLLIQFKS